jgi:hypothetical protein
VPWESEYKTPYNVSLHSRYYHKKPFDSRCLHYPDHFSQEMRQWGMANKQLILQCRSEYTIEDHASMGSYSRSHGSPLIVLSRNFAMLTSISKGKVAAFVEFTLMRSHLSICSTKHSISTGPCSQSRTGTRAGRIFLPFPRPPEL